MRSPHAVSNLDLVWHIKNLGPRPDHRRQNILSNRRPLPANGRPS